MYDQSTQAVRQRRAAQAYYGTASGRSRQGRRSKSKESVRFVQLAICLALFLIIFFGKGVFPQRLERVQEELLDLISADFDFRGALAVLGESLSGGDTFVSDLGAFCVEVFGVGEADQAQTEPETMEPLPPLNLTASELAFLERGTDTAVRTLHYTDFSRFGLELTVPAEEPEQDETPPEETAVTTEPPVVPAAGTVIMVSDYSGQELPENYTMDQLSLGELETMTPVLGQLNSGYGYRDHPINGKYLFHSGVDISGQLGDPIAAFAAGTVEYIGENDSYGLYLQLDHGNGVKSFYGHCSKIEVTKGQSVAMGDVIARVGSTGVSTGPHLHLELKFNKLHLNPAYYVEFLEQ